MPRGNRLRYTKGRQVDADALDEIRALLGAVPPRDELIEALHRIQDRHGALRHRHLAALAELMRLPFAEVFEVATFYSSFRVVEDNEALPQMVVQVCDSWVCAQKGAARLCQALSEGVPEGVRVQHAPCLGRCAGAPAVLVGDNAVDHAGPEDVLEAINQQRTEAVLPPYRDLDAYRANGGYRLLQSCRGGGVCVRCDR